MPKFLYWRLAGLALLSFLAALYGFGLSYPNDVTARSANGQLYQIHPDGWIVDGSEIRLRGLAGRGNKLELNLNDWRPAGIAPAKLEISLCGERLSQEVISSTGVRTFPLKGSCEPRTLRIDVLNPYVAGANDSRKLGAKLISYTITSRFGIPLVNFASILAAAAVIFSASLVFYSVLEGSGYYAISYLVPLGAFAILARSTFFALTQPISLAMFLISCGVGMLLAKAAGEGGAFLFRDAAKEEDRPLAMNSIFLLAILLVACGLRFFGLSFGLPSHYHPDEVPKVNAIMRMVEHGNFDPEYFLHPSLLLYSTYFVNTVFHAVGTDGTFRDTAYLAGRTVSAIAGSLSVFLLFLIGKRLYSSRVGLLAAAILAVLPLHVTCSRYMKEDALLVFTILLCLWTVIKSVQEDRKVLLLLAGFIAGVSASSKYSGILTGLIVVCAPWLKSRDLKPDKLYLKYAVAALLLAPLGFVLCTPYSVLNYQKFLNDFGSEKHHMLRGHTTPIDAWSQLWMYHFNNSVVPGMSMFTAVCAVAAVGFLLWRRRVEDLFLIALILLYYVPAEWVKAKPAPQPERYILPCLPLLALAAAELLRRLSQEKWSRLIVPPLAALLIVVPAMRSLRFASEIRNDTRDQMANWMIGNLPRGSKVYLDWKPYAPRFWHDEFEVTYVPRATIIKMLDVKTLKRSGQDYLVLSSLFYDRYFSQPDGEASVRQRFRDVFDRVPIVKQIGPEFSTYGFHNPTLTLFSLKTDDFAKLEDELSKRQAGQISRTDNEMKASLRWQDRY